MTYKIITSNKVLYKLHENLDEKAIKKAYKNILEVDFRKKILDYLKEENLIESDEKNYIHYDYKINKALNHLIEKRKIYMEKDVELYKKHGPTCAICCLLMVLYYYKKINRPNKLMERNLYRMYKSSYMEGAHYSGIAKQLTRFGLNVKLIHSEESLFKNEKVPYNYIKIS